MGANSVGDVGGVFSFLAFPLDLFLQDCRYFSPLWTAIVLNKKERLLSSLACTKRAQAKCRSCPRICRRCPLMGLHTFAKTAEDLSKLTPYGILYVACSVNSGGTLQREGGDVEESGNQSSDS